MAPLEEPDEDPTFYASACVFRTLIHPLVENQTIVVQAFGAEVVDFAPVPDYRPVFGAYPTALSLYRLEFDYPKVAGTNRFIAKAFFDIKEGGGSEARAFQPVLLDPVMPEIFDIRLSPKREGFYVLRLFVLVSSGVQVQEQTITSRFRVVVPSQGQFAPNSMMG